MCTEGRGGPGSQPVCSRGSVRESPTGPLWGGREVDQTKVLSQWLCLSIGQLPAESGRGHWESFSSERYGSQVS